MLKHLVEHCKKSEQNYLNNNVCSHNLFSRGPKLIMDQRSCWTISIKVLFPHPRECVYPSANRFPTTFENEIRNSICVFCFPVISENEIQTSIFVFHFPTTLENGIPNSIFVFRRHRQLNFNFHFCCTSFYCFTKLMFQSVLWSFRSTARINIGTSFLCEKAWKTMAIFWCE